MQEDGPDRGNVDLDILPRSVRYRLRDVMDDVRSLAALVHDGFPGPAAPPRSWPHDANFHMPCVQGRITKNDIDARMLKALADLPVDLGIEAIDKFAMASLDSVRSKTGFMVRRLPLPCGLLDMLLWKSIGVDVIWHAVACRWGSSSACSRTSLAAIGTPTLLLPLATGVAALGRSCHDQLQYAVSALVTVGLYICRDYGRYDRYDRYDRG